MISLSGRYSLNINHQGKNQVICLFFIKQRLIDKLSGESCLHFMEDIARCFNCKVYYKSGNAIVFVAQSFTNTNLVKSYFEEYPLMTSKHLNYLSFLKGFDYRGKYLSDNEIIEIQSIKNSMNSKRIYFN
jgi:hypothetical protein